MDNKEVTQNQQLDIIKSYLNTTQDNWVTDAKIDFQKYKWDKGEF